jgi:outer membrane protein TolC
MKKHVLLSLISLFCLAEGYSQIAVSASLDDAIQKALAKSSSVKNKELEIEKLNLQKKSIWNKYIPTVEATAMYLYFDNRMTIDLPTVTVANYPLLDGKTSFDNYGNIFHGGVMAKTVLFSGLQIPNGAKAIEQKAIGTAYLTESEKDGIVKDVINTFDQLALLDEVERLINDSEKRLNAETLRVTKAIEQGLEPLANIILQQKVSVNNELIQKYINKQKE